jgi:predicted TIM-barrel fold metal-dependent hydrolase
MKFSSGSASPRIRLPDNTVDSHHHIFDARFPPAPNATLLPADALIADYQVLQQRLGIQRHVLVQPSTYGTDNRLMLESMAIFGQTRCRGVAVVDTQVSDQALEDLHSAGVRGIRFNLALPGPTTLDMVGPLSTRIASLGWHLQVNAPANLILQARQIWADLPVPVVFDHLGRVPQPGSLQHPVCHMLLDLLQQGRAYVKLSGFYNESAVGSPSYADSVALARRYAHEAPERVLWGSDWPHPTEAQKGYPDDAALVDCLVEAVPDEAAQQLVFVVNPQRLYGFD